MVAMTSFANGVKGRTCFQCLLEKFVENILCPLSHGIHSLILRLRSKYIFLMRILSSSVNGILAVFKVLQFFFTFFFSTRHRKQVWPLTPFANDVIAKSKLDKQ